MTHPAISLRTDRDSPWGQQIADRVPGTYEYFRLMAPEHCGFTGWYRNIYIHLHGLTVVIWEESVHRQMDIYTYIFIYASTHTCTHTYAHTCRQLRSINKLLINLSQMNINFYQMFKEVRTCLEITKGSQKMNNVSSWCMPLLFLFILVWKIDPLSVHIIIEV